MQATTWTLHTSLALRLAAVAGKLTGHSSSYSGVGVVYLPTFSREKALLLVIRRRKIGTV